MNLRVPRVGLLGTVVAVLVAAALFVYLMGRFGGPSLHLSSTHRVTATFPDSKGLAVRSDVLVRGVKVGQVERIALHQRTTDVTFTIAAGKTPIFRDATVRAGEKTLLGESYVDLDPGHARAGALPDGATLPAASTHAAAVEIDEALNALDPGARSHLIDTLGTFAEGARARQAPAQVSQSLAQLSSSTGALRRLTEVLRGQEPDIARGVLAARTVLGELGRREGRVRAIVSAGRATLGALAGRDAGLRAGMRELPALLATARTTLDRARPLLRDARPLLSDLRTAAAPLTAALRVLPPVATRADAVVAGLHAFNGAALPALSRAETLLGALRPVSHSLPPALRNLVTMAQYLSPRRDTFAAWFANTGDIGASRDAKGFFARFFIFMDPGTTTGSPTSAQANPYTQPQDALSNQPYSGYQQQRAYDPPPR